MSKVVKITESDITNIVKRILEQERSDRYMFFSNLQQIRRQMDILLDMDPDMVESVLEDGHDWAQDHIATAKESIDQVFDFLMNSEKEEEVMVDGNIIEGKKKKNVATNQKLWKQSLSWARQRYDVCPSAYCHGAAVKRYNSKGGKWKKE
jgi:hypothetical protein